MTRANYHSLKGQAVETVGNLTGAETWQRGGREERVQGDAEYDAARAQGYVEGAADRIGGKKDNIVGAVTGDKNKQFGGTLIACIHVVVGADEVYRFRARGPWRCQAKLLQERLSILRSL
ncbi:hypothetical protein BD626DRAFT_476325 [Schizophyllum amplum]|uniref:CsbD-like domain-containing protein n=1 Tax=Schizophyllum amplum TaxID=97359 RepID=A0A550CZA1_9AGAR|nr:hypothetical protein BD626DRAFT_476325 [Auriculariopsis ampla]